MTPGCDRISLLEEFKDQNTQQITAASMRLFVNCVYDNFVDLSKVIDNCITYDPYLALSANQGAVLNDKLNTLSTRVQDNTDLKADKNDVYNKLEIDDLFYTKGVIDYNYYKKTEVYNKQEIDDLINTLQDSINQLNSRIDNIVQKNDLVE
jgi:hypothetical protein